MQLKLQEAGALGARYSVELSTGDGVWSAFADVERTGAVRLGEWTAPPPPWLADAVQVLLRSVARTAAAGIRVGPGAAWPRRVQRWRASP